MTVSEAIDYLEDNEFDTIEEVSEYLDDNDVEYYTEDITSLNQEIIILENDNKYIIHFINNEQEIEEALHFCERYGKQAYTWKIEPCDEPYYYHRTNSGDSIIQEGLTFLSRGGTQGNKHLHGVIFTSTNEYGFRQYGKNIIEINTEQLKKDGYSMGYSHEPDAWEHLSANYLANDLGIDMDYEEDYESAWMNSDTRILFPSDKFPKNEDGYYFIPPKYLRLDVYES